MSTKLKYDKFVKELRLSKNNIRCKDLIKGLTMLGFEVRDGSKVGHKVYTHDGVLEFLSSSFTCGHGSNAIVKSNYIVKVRKTLEEHEEEIIEYLEGDA